MGTEVFFPKPFPEINQESRRTIRDILRSKEAEYSKVARWEPVERFRKDYETIAADMRKIIEFLEEK